MNKTNLNQILDTRITNTKKIKANKTFVEVRTAVTTDEFVAFVNTVTELSFDKSGMYNGAFERIAVRYAVVKFLTNIDVTDMTVNNVFDCTFQSWFKAVMNAVESTSYWDDLMGAVCDNIACKTESMLRSRKTSYDKLFDTLSEAVSDFAKTNSSESIETLKEIAERLNAADNPTLIGAIAAHAKKSAENG